MANVLVTDAAWRSLEIERTILEAAGATLIAASSGELEELIELAPQADAVLTCWKPVTSEVLEAAPRCTVVARYGVGLDNIAVERATELGIVVTNVPDFCVDEVSDHTLALILALRRHVQSFARQTSAGVWDNTAAGPMHRLRGQTLGLVGYGRTGRAVAAKARALGMQVLAFAPSRVGVAGEPGVRFATSLEEVLSAADVVSLHLPSTPQTRKLIAARELGLMKPNAILINTSRGVLVDGAALARAVDEGTIAGAGLDVMAEEPPDPEDPLLSSEQIIVTPHAAFSSEESTAELRRRASRHVADVLHGDVPSTIVNPAVLERPELRMRTLR